MERHDFMIASMGHPLRRAGRRWIRPALLLLSLAGPVSGCGRQDPKSPAADRAAVSPAAPAADRAAVNPAAPAADRAAADRPGDAPAKPGAIETFQPASSVRSGRPMSLTEAYPGYRPGAEDPEIESVRRGRRIVARHDRGFDPGGSPSLEALVQLVATGIDMADGEMLGRAAITSHDFSDLLWPEFPQSRPAANGSVSGAWFLIRSELVSTWNRAAGEYRGKGLKVVDIKVGHVDEYTNFRIHNDLQVTVTDAEGNAMPFPLVEAVVECRGRFKLYSTRD